MKDTKIDEFIDRSISGNLDENICDNIITFLKVDVRICDALLGMDFTDIESIVDRFGDIFSILDEAPEPRSQSIYEGSLISEQKLIEYWYNQMIEYVQDYCSEGTSVCSDRRNLSRSPTVSAYGMPFSTQISGLKPYP